MSKSGKAIVVRGNARNLPLPDASVDLIVTSPPYFALRSYRDSGNHYEGQIGSEPTPQEWLEALWACMAEWWRVLKPTGPVFVNLGDKRTGSGGHNNSGIAHPAHNDWHMSRPERPLSDLDEAKATEIKATRRNAPDRYNQAAFGRAKSKMMLPHRFAIGCEDGLADPEGIGWIVRQDLCWQKLNGLPESVTDRHRDSHEFIFHFTKQERYFAALDEIREGYSERVIGRQVYAGRDILPSRAYAPGDRNDPDNAAGILGFGQAGINPLGKLPGSVWPMASEPLIIPQWAKEKYGLSDHFAAFPSELPRKLILGFSPSGICVECGEGRWPVVSKDKVKPPAHSSGSITGNRNGGPDERQWDGLPRHDIQATIIGYACACTPYTDHKGTGKDNNQPARAAEHLDGWTPPPTRPAVVLDPFGGTGTVAMVAKALGRIGISVDLSADYSRLAQWRIFESGHGKKAEQRTWGERQGSML